MKPQPRGTGCVHCARPAQWGAALSWKQPARVWTLFNDIAALVLGILVYRGWSYSSFSILGFFFGINLVFKGAAQFVLGVAPRTSSAAAA